MEGTVNYEGSGDVFFAFYKGDNEQLTEMPKKDNPEKLGFDHAECSNGASVEWDSISWAPKVLNITKTKTKCTLYFSEKDSLNKLEDLMKKNPSTFAYDDTSDKNLRYIGKNPNNYIDIGDRDSEDKPILWRVIGAMKNISVIDEYGDVSSIENLIKIIRAEDIGDWSWDSSASTVNYGSGVNEWSQADLMTTLNSGLYWNKTSGQCYYRYDNGQKPCDFSSTGLTKEARNKLARVRWNTGTVGEVYSSSKITSSYIYQAERSNYNGKEQCASSGGRNCNDPVERRTTWDGFIGLMYPSDYGYAVGGSERTECLAKSIYNWIDSSPDCKGNDWLIDSSSTQWTITPVPASTEACNALYLFSSGGLSSYSASGAHAVRPTAYLKSSVKIQNKTDSDYGSSSNPFIIE